MNRKVVYGDGERHQIVITAGFYWLLDTENDHVKASMTVKGWTIDCQKIFEQYCDKWNTGVYRDGLDTVD